MSTNKLWVRLTGDLSPSEELSKLLGITPTTDRRRGMPLRVSTHGEEEVGVQEVDVWSLILIERAQWMGLHPDEAALAEAIATLRRLAPALASLDRMSCRAQLYLSSIREEEMGGFELPAELIAAACAGGLELVVSILVMWPSDEEEEEEDMKEG